jgi:hypothetical protein
MLRLLTRMGLVWTSRVEDGMTTLRAPLAGWTPESAAAPTAAPPPDGDGPD